MIRTSGHRAILLLAGALALGLSTSPVAAGKGKKHEIRCSCRDVDPDDFTCRVDNKYFPLKPGTTYYYESSSGETEEVYVITRGTLTMRFEDEIRTVEAG